MFTGIIQAIGKVREPEPLGNGVRLTICAPDLGLDEVRIGDSIAVNGACMTVVEKTDTEFKVDVSAESLSKTTGLDTFGEVNLEKAMRLGDRVDGHLVSGHVDGVGQVESMEQVAESWRLVIRAPRPLSVSRLQGLDHGQRRLAYDQQGRGYGDGHARDDQPHPAHGRGDDAQAPQGPELRQS